MASMSSPPVPLDNAPDAPLDNAPDAREVSYDQLVDKTKKLTKRVNNTIASFRDRNMTEFTNNMFEQFEFKTNPYMTSTWGPDAIHFWVHGIPPNGGAIEQLILELHGGQHEFGYGSMGSIWFDTDLTGGGKTKKTRVCIGPSTDDAEEGNLSHNGKKLSIMLDATFSEEW